MTDCDNTEHTPSMKNGEILERQEMAVGPYSVNISECEWLEPERAFWSVRDQACVAFLDSAMRGYTDSRWSYLALDPALELQVLEDGAWVRARGNTVWDPVGDWKAVVRRFLERRPEKMPRDAPPFAGGWIGWFGYELGAEFDRIASHGARVLGSPLANLAFYDSVDCFDLGERRRWRVSTDDESSTALEDLVRDVTLVVTKPDPITLTSSLYHQPYCWAVTRIKDYINAGDIYQANLSQQYSTRENVSAPDIYMRLRSASPAPYAAFLSSSAGTLISSSPELFLKYNPSERELISRPVKGARPRGETHDEDIQLAEDLSASEKDRAENVMIVDLVRNDLGRVCEPGSVETREICRLEIHPSVFHLVSTVSGILKRENDTLDVLKAAFPGGSVTGTPKIRACEIIRELEPVARGPYTGALGYMSLTGDSTLAISIRVIWSSDQGMAFSVGGAVVADSDEEMEYQETLVKGAAIARALGFEDGLKV